jgi:4-amino-4-deoxy-L-arabinose transferase-like glycosyltransferase
MAICTTLLLAGFCTKIYLGDEVYHFRFAKDAYNSHSRPVFDSQYGTSEMPTILYTSPPFWNLSLAILWKITVGLSVFVAQFYQVIYFAIIVATTYLIGKELYSEEEAKTSSLLAATVPMIVSFSIILYTDVPAAALCLSSLLFTIKKRYLVAGFLWGVALLTKNNSVFFIPGVIFFLFFSSGERFVTKLKNAFMLFMPLIIMFSLDFRWRLHSFSKNSIGVIQGITLADKAILPDKTGIIQTLKAIIIDFWATRVVHNVSCPMTKTIENLNSRLLSIKDLLIYLGISFLVLAILYFFKKKYEKKDRLLITFIISYMICTFIAIGLNTDIRYFMPIVPLLCILVSKSLTDIKRAWVKPLLVCVCLFQFIVTVSYVSYKRNVTPQIEEAFEFIQNNTPADSLILYPEPNIQEYAQRKLVWSNLVHPTRPGNIFWPKDTKEIKNTIRLNEIDYIVIKKTRCYDDAEYRHLGGFPDSFVKRLPHYEFVRLIFDNKEVAIWQIKENI